LPPPPKDEDRHFDTFQNYEIEADRRDDLRECLGKKGVGSILQWGGKGVHQFKALGFDVSLLRTERMFERAMLLPMNTSLRSDEVDYVSEQIRIFYSAR
jgi:dTDP-4-amino-4,6-dideoxygalactose transaminase